MVVYRGRQCIEKTCNIEFLYTLSKSGFLSGGGALSGLAVGILKNWTQFQHVCEHSFMSYFQLRVKYNALSIVLFARSSVHQ